VIWRARTREVYWKCSVSNASVCCAESVIFRAVLRLSWYVAVLWETRCCQSCVLEFSAIFDRHFRLTNIILFNSWRSRQIIIVQTGSELVDWWTMLTVLMRQMRECSLSNTYAEQTSQVMCTQLIREAFARRAESMKSTDLKEKAMCSKNKS